MKTLIVVLSILFTIFAVSNLSAQKATATPPKKQIIPVWGECEMCKGRIEKAARTAGATTANWNEDTKQLEFTYSGKSSGAAKIQQAIAGAGYDTKDFSASQAAYQKLPGCCHYERKQAPAQQAVADCCNNEKTCSKNEVCCKDGNCQHDLTACKDMAACKDNTCCKS